MSERLAVFLDGQRIGVLTQSDQGALGFSYDEAYRSVRGATPLSLSLPLAVADHRSRPTRTFLQGLLPDSPARLEQLAREFGVSPRNPFAMLARMGTDAAGAVQILPEGEDSSDAAARQGDVTILDEDDFADVVADVIANRDSWGSREASEVRWSLPGAQPKIALFRTESGQWAVPDDSTPTTHIVKPAVPPYADHHINELMTMAAARNLGIDVADDFVVTTSRGDSAFVSVRYDRRREHGRWRRLHQEDLCQALAVPPEKKYQSDGGPGIARIAAFLSALPHADDARTNVRKFFDAIVFNVAALGTDAHAKNYSLLLDGDRATFAPLYDLGSHAPYPVRDGRPMRLAMSVGGEYRADAINTVALLALAKKLRIDADEAQQRVRAITGGIVDAFRQAADEARAVLGPTAFGDALVDSIREHAVAQGWHRQG